MPTSTSKPKAERRTRPAAPLPLETPLADLPSISPQRRQALHRLGIHDVRGLLWHLPRRYDDQRERLPIGRLSPGVTVTVEARLRSLSSRRARYRRMDLVEGVVEDETGSVDVVWFNQPLLRQVLHPGDRVTLHGKVVRGRRGRLQLRSPDVERESQRLSASAVGGLVPVYPETYGISSKWLRYRIGKVLTSADLVDDPLAELLAANGVGESEAGELLPLPQALRQVHQPQSQAEAEGARHRFELDELFFLQLANSLARRQRERLAGFAIPYQTEVARDFVGQLPFALTEDQRRAAHEILTDMSRPRPMNRLLQGDVGAGKTVVAAMAARMAIAAGYQVVLMAPTEILARQHFATLAGLLPGIEVDLLLGATGAAQRRRLLARLGPPPRREPQLFADGERRVDLLVGTHALVEEDVRFERLGLCIVDEQHRFGVQQRLRLRQKAAGNPDFLSMTATPIPRSLLLTLYGDLEVSTLRHGPPDRQPPTTRIVEPSQREQAYRLIRDRVEQGAQAYVICPLVEDSPLSEAKSATAEYERLQQQEFSELRLTLLHGRLSDPEKARRMEAFAAHEYDIMVATSVIEVGIDVPNATVIAIEGAERFGLAQLHQFRGRVSRGTAPAECLLFSDDGEEAGRRRLQALVDHPDGFQVAELDLRLRGPGDRYGLRQHGMPEMLVADLLDHQLRERARQLVERVLESGRGLRAPRLRRALRGYQVVFEFD